MLNNRVRWWAAWLIGSILGAVAIKFSFGPWPLGDIVAIVVGARIGSAFKIKDGVLLSASIGATTGIYLGYLAASDFPPLEIRIVGILLGLTIGAVFYAIVSGIINIVSKWLTKVIFFLLSRSLKFSEHQITFDNETLFRNILSILVVLSVAGLLFASRSAMQSVVAFTVGWAQVLAWLIDIVRNHSISVSNKRRVYLGMLVLTILFSFWAWFGIKQENAFAPVSTESAAPENALPNDYYAVPDNNFALPTAEHAGVSVRVDSWASDSKEQILIHELDRTTPVQEIDRSWLGKPASLLWSQPVRLRLYVTGQGQDQIQIERKIPVKLVSYSPLVPTNDIIRPTYWLTVDPQVSLFQLSFSQDLKPTSVYQATFNEIYNLREMANDVAGSVDWRDLPQEIQTYILETDNATAEFLPNVFTLKKDQRILYTAAVTFAKPGVYEIQPGIEYIHEGKHYVAWSEAPIRIIVPQTYYLWQVFAERNDKLVIGLEEFCQPDQNPVPQCTFITITHDALEAVGIERFTIEHKTVDRVEKYTITNNIPSPFGGSISGVWSLTREVFALNSEEGIYVYNLDSIESPKFLESPEASIVIFSINGEFLATGGGDGTVELWKRSEGIRLFELKSHFLPVSAMAFSPDDSLIASASRDTTVNISRVSDGKLLLELVAEVDSDPMSGSMVEEVGFSPDMQFIYAVDTIGIVSMWTLPDGKPFARFENFMRTDWRTNDLEFSPDSKQIALLTSGGSGPSDLTLWSLQDGSLILSKPNSIDGVAYGLAFSNDGKTLAALQGIPNPSMPGDMSAFLILYDTSNGRELGRFDLEQSTWADLVIFAWSPDNKLLASCTSGKLFVWRVSDGELILKLETSLNAETVEFSPDGANIILNSGLESEIWRVSDGKLISVLKTKSSVP